MDHYETIYRSQAGAYQRMIAAEDVDGNLITAIQRVCDPRGKRLLDLGCGTGRLPGLLQSMTSYLVGIELHRAMLEENAAIRNDSGGGWSLVQGDMRWLPFAAKTFDILTAGWAIGHMRGWFSQNWKAAIGQVLDEMHRATCPGGALIIRRRWAPVQPHLPHRHQNSSSIIFGWKSPGISSALRSKRISSIRLCRLLSRRRNFSLVRSSARKSSATIGRASLSGPECGGKP
jgi:SAM-dependent methyltransferase